MDCKVPLLLSRNVLGKLGMVCAVDSQMVDLKALKLFGVPLKMSDTGHPALVVNQFPRNLEKAGCIWSSDPDVRFYLTAAGQYMASAAGGGQGKINTLFYPKKIAVEINNMLSHEHLSAVSFLAWWRNANQSRDFWIETSSEFVRVHVVPRRDVFDPSKWNTSLQHLKSQLLSSLESKRITEAIPCQSEVATVFEQVEVWQQPSSASIFWKCGGLWIGRSRFSKKVQNSLPTGRLDVIPSSTHLAMEHEARGAGEGTQRAPSSCAPQLDSARTQGNAHRAAPGPNSNPGATCLERNQQDVPGGAQDQSSGGGLGDAAESHEGLAHQSAEGQPSARGGPGHDVRQVQVMDVQRGAILLSRVGDEGDGGEHQQQPGASPLCSMVPPRAGGTEATGQRKGSPHDGGGPRGECKDPSPGDERVSLECADVEIYGVGNDYDPGRQEGSQAEEGHGDDRCGEHGCAGPGGGGRADCTVGGPSCDPSPRTPASFWGNSVKVIKAAIGLGKQSAETEECIVSEGDATVGLGKRIKNVAVPEYDMRGGRMDKGDAFENDITVGHGSGTVYKAAPVYDMDKGGCPLQAGEVGATAAGRPQERHVYGAPRARPDGWFDEAGRSPKQRARDGAHKRKINASTRRKLHHMGKQVMSVLFTCALAVGSMAEEIVMETFNTAWVTVRGPMEYRADCLELFAGEHEISAAFARAKMAVLRPRDLRFGDDLRDGGQQEAVLREIKEQRPKVVWIAPPCTYWCAFSRLNYTKQQRRRLRAKEKPFLDLIDEVMLLQRQLGGHVVIENPSGSDLWNHSMLRRWAADDEVYSFNLDMCQFGLRSGLEGDKFLKKGTRLMATHIDFMEGLQRKCDGAHDHRLVQGSDTARSAHYSMDFAEAVVDVVKNMQAHQVLVTEEPQDAEMVEEGEITLEDERGALGIKFKGSVSSKIAGALRRLHQNLGHPNNRELERHLRLAGADSEMVKAVSQLQCSTCAKCARPQPQRVAKPTALLDFNDAVALDIIFIDTAQTKAHLALNMVDIASSYQVVIPLPNRKAETVADTFYKHWASWAGIPGKLVLDLDTCFRDAFWDLTNNDGIAMRCAAGQAHWQNGVAERYGGAWKAIWDRLHEEHIIGDSEVYEAACAVSEARNTLRNRSGFSPRQWVFGTQGRLGPNLEDDAHDLASLSHITADEKMSRKHQLKLGAKMAFFHCQNKDAVRRAVQHRSRVLPTQFKAGDLVYVYRDAKTKGKRAASKWIGPATIIGPEGSNFWVARGGRCLLAAGEHLRPAEHEEVSEALRIKAALLQIRQCIDADFEEAADDMAEDVGPQGAAAADKEIDVSMEAEAEGIEGELDAEVEAAGSSSGPMTRVPVSERVARAAKREKEIQQMARKKQALDDLPFSLRSGTIKHHLKRGDDAGNIKEAHFTKHGGSQEALDKALEKEIPWNLIAPEEKELFKQAEVTQWEEHLKYEAVKPLSEAESKEVEEKYGKERILTSRFLYRDKNLAKRRTDAGVPCKAKARLCVGGQRDPDLGVVDMAVDAPTVNRHSLLLGLVVALSFGWTIRIGDIRAAFLNGVQSSRRLFFRQPARGIPGLRPGQLVEILKGVFGLATSPKLWWLKLSTDLLSLSIQCNGLFYSIEQNEIDPCAFRIMNTNTNEVAGLIFTHVDDLMVMAEQDLVVKVQEAIQNKFPVDDWEGGHFEYVGCEYKVTENEITITQTGYVESRLNKIVVPSGCRDEDAATEDLVKQHRSVVGCLSWLAKQTRPDIQFDVAQAQRVQGRPSYGDIKAINKVVDQAKKYKENGIKIPKIDRSDMVILGYHDAAWANADLPCQADIDTSWDGDFKLGSQLASLVVVADKKCLQNQPGAFGVLDWRSHGSQRVCRSTFAGETMACGEALESCIFLRSLLLSFTNGRLVGEAEAGALMGLHLFTDCKSLFDHLHREGIPRAPSERRLALDLAAIRQSLAVEARHEWKRNYGSGTITPEKPCKPPIHWVPTDQQLADVLTKHLNPAGWWETILHGFLALPFMPRQSQFGQDTEAVSMSHQ